MTENNEKATCKCNCHKPAATQAIYGFGFIGALVYYLQHSTSFGNGLLGIVKAIGWPAVILYKVLEVLGL